MTTSPAVTIKKENLHHVRCSVDGSKQCMGIDAPGNVYTWGKTNEMGQLGRPTCSSKQVKTPTRVEGILPTKARRVYAGGCDESGHSVVLAEDDDRIYVAGCDRWQQLGLGSSEAGAAGYTWENGMIWRPFFTENIFLPELMKKKSDSAAIRDVALGWDHTVILASNRKDVYTFGKGGDGQLGLVGKPFVSASVKSSQLSQRKPDIAAVCAMQHCSMTLNDDGEVLDMAGKCKVATEAFKSALKACIDRAARDGLVRIS